LAASLAQHPINERRKKMISIHKSAGVLAALLLAPSAWAALLTFESAGPDAAAITPTRDAFRSTVGGGSIAAANGSFGGLRREINWDGVPEGRTDPNLLPADFFNVNSPRGVVFSTPGSGFLVSTNGGAANPTLFGFPGDFQAFSAQKLFTAVNSNITDVTFFVPGTTLAATTSAFGAVFVDVESAGLSRMEFFDDSDALIYARDVLVAGNQGLSFLGAVATGGEKISRVRLTSGLNTIVANGLLGNPNDDVVVMDDFLYAEPSRAVPEPAALALAGLGLVCGLIGRRQRRPAG
jgi:hypothetical protein